ncbi:hypothetical protein NBRC116586_28890 [Pseudooceanicola nitratireducens]
MIPRVPSWNITSTPMATTNSARISGGMGFTARSSLEKDIVTPVFGCRVGPSPARDQRRWTKLDEGRTHG